MTRNNVPPSNLHKQPFHDSFLVTGPGNNKVYEDQFSKCTAPWKAKLPLLPFNRHPNQEQSKRMYDSTFFDQLSIKSKLQPTKCNGLWEPLQWSTAILRIDLLLLVHIVYCRTKITAATTVDFFSRTRHYVNLVQRRDAPTTAKSTTMSGM